MSTQNRGNIPEIGERLKEERRRLCLSQEALCLLIGVKDPKTLRSWESGTTAPTLFDLVSFVERGADIGYVLTGVRSALLVRKDGANYETPASAAAAEIAAMTFAAKDAELILALAKRLDSKKT